MKKLIIIALVAFIFVSTGRAQDKVIDKVAFDLLMNQYRRPPAEWQGIARRITSESTDQTTGRPSIVSNRKQVKEYDSNGRIRIVTESTINGNTSRTETIKIGDEAFTKKDLGKWTPVRGVPDLPIDINAPFESTAGNERGGTSAEPGAKFEFRIAAGEHKGESVVICSRIQWKERVNPSTGTKIEQEIVNRYWLSDRNRRMVKYEQFTSEKSVDFERRSSIASQWETDPKIVITAPIAAIINP